MEMTGATAGAAAVAGIGPGAGRALAQAAEGAPAPFQLAPPSERIVTAHVGVGQRGTSVLREFLASPNVRVAAVCDADSSHALFAQTVVEKSRGAAPEVVEDFRRLLERPDIDAIVIGTPDHWHAAIATAAMAAGKDVYCEKPLSHNLAELAAITDCARAHKRVTQMGIQIHNDPSRNFARVAKTIQSGVLGKILKVRLWKVDPAQKYGTPPDCAPPPELNHDLWLGPAPERAYNPNRGHFKWRYWWDYAGGKFADFGCHIQDIAFWSLGLEPAKWAAAGGGKYLGDDNTETPDSLEVLWGYDDMVMVWSQTVGSSLDFYGMGSIGAIFQGSEATLVCNYGDYKIFSEGGKHEELPKPEIALDPWVSHYQEFVNSVKTRVQPSCNFDYGAKLTTNIHLGNIAHRSGARVEWDNAKRVLSGPPEAVKLASREYRGEWKLES